MVHIDTLSIDNKTLVLSASIDDSPYYENVFLDKVIIDTQDTFKPSGPSDRAVYSSTIDGNKKKIALVIPFTDILASEEKDLLIVYVKSKGNPTMDVPCGSDNPIAAKAIMDFRNIYCRLITFLKSPDKCGPNRAFINEYFKYKLISLAMLTSNLDTLVRYFKKFYTNRSLPYTPNCHCNG